MEEIEVLSADTTIYVGKPYSEVSLTVPGPQGPQGVAGAQGPPGPQGPSGSSQFNVQIVTSPTFEEDLTLYSYLSCDCTSNGIVITLPTSNIGNEGLSVIITRIDHTTNTLSVQTMNHSQQILNVGATLFLIPPGGSFTFTSVGTGYELS